MPRKPRFYLPRVPVHAVQRGNCRQAVFFCDEDYTAYLNWLQEGAERHGCAIHAWVLMTNHVHLLVTPTTCESTAGIGSQARSGKVGTRVAWYRMSVTCWHACAISSSIRCGQGWSQRPESIAGPVIMTMRWVVRLAWCNRIPCTGRWVRMRRPEGHSGKISSVHRGIRISFETFAIQCSPERHLVMIGFGNK
jgi:hypothetical protein